MLSLSQGTKSDSPAVVGPGRRHAVVGPGGSVPHLMYKKGGF